MFVIKDTKVHQQMRKQTFVVNREKRAIKVIQLVQIHVTINNHTVMALVRGIFMSIFQNSFPKHVYEYSMSTATCFQGKMRKLWTSL